MTHKVTKLSMTTRVVLKGYRSQPEGIPAKDEIISAPKTIVNNNDYILST